MSKHSYISDTEIDDRLFNMWIERHRSLVNKYRKLSEDPTISEETKDEYFTISDAISELIYRRTKAREAAICEMLDRIDSK